MLLCYWTVSAGFEMLTGYESSFIPQNEYSWEVQDLWLLFFFNCPDTQNKKGMKQKEKKKKNLLQYFEAPLLHSFQLMC